MTTQKPAGNAPKKAPQKSTKKALEKAPKPRRGAKSYGA